MLTYDHLRKTNIYEAVEVGNLPYVFKWLAKGGDPNLFDDLNGEPLLVTACRENRTDVVRALLNANADIESCAEDGEGPLEIAVGFGAWECAELLVDRGAETVDAGLSDVMVAAMLGRLDDLRKLLADGSDPDEITHEGETAAPLAVRSHNFEAFELLVTAGADINRVNTNFWFAKKVHLWPHSTRMRRR